MFGICIRSDEGKEGQVHCSQICQTGSHSTKDSKKGEVNAAGHWEKSRKSRLHTSLTNPTKVVAYIDAFDGKPRAAVMTSGGSICFVGFDGSRIDVQSKERGHGEATAIASNGNYLAVLTFVPDSTESGF